MAKCLQRMYEQGAEANTQCGLGFGPLLIHALGATSQKWQNFVKSPG